jgi:outer membrane protein assembly factor BamE
MLRSLFLLLVLAALSGCGVPRIPGITPYKPEIQQGNYLSQDVVSQIKPGMSREQVRFILGTPLLTDPFHADRWDYVYWKEAQNGKREERRIALFFTDGKLDRIAGDAQLAPGSPAAGR